MIEEFIAKWSSQVKKGTLSYIVISVLEKGEFYGYDLIEQIKQYTKLEVAEGTLYPLLNRLKKQGVVESKWVEQTSGIPRKYYHLTEDGKQVAKAMDLYWEELNHSLVKIKQ